MGLADSLYHHWIVLKYLAVSHGDYLIIFVLYRNYSRLVNFWPFLAEHKPENKTNQ